MVEFTSPSPREQLDVVDEAVVAYHDDTLRVVLIPEQLYLVCLAVLRRRPLERLVADSAGVDGHSNQK